MSNKLVPPRKHAIAAPRHARASTRRRRVFVWIGLVTAVLVVVCGVGVAVVYNRLAGNLARNVIAAPPGQPPLGPTIPNWDGEVNLLILGSDVRAGQTTGDYGPAEGARSDLMMLLHISASHEDAVLISIPRDTMLPIPECIRADGSKVPAQRIAQINGALDVGPYCSLTAIRDFTGLEINHFIQVDFDGFVAASNAIGGVEVCVTKDVNDKYSGLSLTKGPHTLKGAEALAFIRTRHGFGDGSDLGRISAQQAFLASLARKIKSSDTLTNPVVLFNLADSLSQHIQVDEGLKSVGDLVGLAGALAHTSLDKMTMIQLPVRAYPPDRNRVEPIPEQAGQIFSSLGNDQPLNLARLSPGAGAIADPDHPAEPTPDPGATAPAPETGSPQPLPGTVLGQTASEFTCTR